MGAHDLSRAGVAAENCVEDGGGEGEAVECGIKSDQYRQKRDTVANRAAYAKPAKRNLASRSRGACRDCCADTHRNDNPQEIGNSNVSRMPSPRSLPFGDPRGRARQEIGATP